MRRILLGLPLLAASLSAQAQQIVLPCVPSGNSCIPVSAANPLPTTGGGGGGITVGTTTVTSGGANGVLFNNGGVIGADTGFTYAGSGAQVSINGAALGATTAFVVGPASASGLLADFQVGGVSKASISSAGVGNFGAFASVGSGGTFGYLASNLASNALWLTAQASGNGGTTGVRFAFGSTDYFGMAANSGLFWTIGSGNFYNSTIDSTINRDGANTLALTSGGSGSSASPMALRIYHDDSSSGTVFSRMELGFNAHSGVAAIDVAAATSTLPTFGIYSAGTIKFDYGVTTAATWTLTAAVATTGTLTVGTVNSATGLFVCETAGLLSSGITTCVASDRSVKHDIVAIDDGNLLDKVLGQRGVRFTYNEAKGAPGRRIGVIANDWEANFPELVDFDTDGIRHFDYAATWGLSVEMFRRLRADNDSLRAEVEALRRSVAR
jgi:hypothetical protein